MHKIASFFEPKKETSGAAISEDGVWLVGYRYPMITTYARTSADEVYNLLKAIDATFDLYSKTTSSSANWAIDMAGHPPADAPWHEGAIRYMKEKGLWTKEDQAWNDERLARLKQVIAAWDDATEEFNKMRAEKEKAGEKIDVEEAWPAWWESYRAKHLN